jgi:predicted metal-dependent phosphoesterase TrpH
LFRIDLHVHTKYSRDCESPVEDAVAAAKAAGLKGIAITDHNTIGGNAEGDRLSTEEFLVIPGIEISSRDGHILGLGVNKLIPKNLSASDTIELIREQGGIAISAHPFGIARRIGSVSKARFDAVEVFNSRAYFISNGLARRFAERNGLPMVAGSDAHCPDEIGFAGVEMNCKLELETVLNAIKRGEASTFGRPLPIILFLRRALHKFLRRRW